MEAWIRGLSVRSAEGFIFPPERAARSPAMKPDQASHRWTGALRRARAAGIAPPKDFTGRKLRATFVTHLRESGADFETLQCYIRQAPASVLAVRYDRLVPERLKAIADLAKGLFERFGAERENTAASH